MPAGDLPDLEDFRKARGPEVHQVQQDEGEARGRARPGARRRHPAPDGDAPAPPVQPARDGRSAALSGRAPAPAPAPVYAPAPAPAPPPPPPPAPAPRPRPRRRCLRSRPRRAGRVASAQPVCGAVADEEGEPFAPKPAKPVRTLDADKPKYDAYSRNARPVDGLLDANAARAMEIGLETGLLQIWASTWSRTARSTLRSSSSRSTSASARSAAKRCPRLPAYLAPPHKRPQGADPPRRAAPIRAAWSAGAQRRVARHRDMLNLEGCNVPPIISFIRLAEASCATKCRSAPEETRHAADLEPKNTDHHPLPRHGPHARRPRSRFAGAHAATELTSRTRRGGL